MPKIKSITINLPINTTSHAKLVISDTSKLDKDQLQALESLAIIDGQIEYEPEPTLLKRPDGSLITELEEGSEITIIDIDFSLIRVVYKDDLLNRILIKQGKVFLRKDETLALKKALMLTKQNIIQFEINRLNAEEGKNFGQVFCFRLSKDKETVEVLATFENTLNVLLFSNGTAETILAKYSQDELKQYLGIII